MKKDKIRCSISLTFFSNFFRKPRILVFAAILTVSKLDQTEEKVHALTLLYEKAQTQQLFQEGNHWI